MTRRGFVLALVALAAAVASHRPLAAQPAGAAVRVLVETSLGDIVLELDPVHAPNTTANFLKYVDAGHYDGARSTVR